VNVLLNKGDGTFAKAKPFAACDGASAIVVGQFNPTTDSHLDVAMICGGQRIGRMLGDGQGHLGQVQTLDVSYLAAAAGTGNQFIAIISFLRLGAMDGSTLVYAGYIPQHGQTLCFLRVADLEFDLEHSGANGPYCNIHTDVHGDVDDWGPVTSDIAVGEDVAFPGHPVADEAVSGGVSETIGSYEVPIAVTSYTPFFASTWSYGARASGNTGTAVALADLDGDGQNDLLIGGTSLTANLTPSANGASSIADYVPGDPIDQGATPTHTVASVPYLYDMVTADFDRDGKVDIAAVGDDDDDSGDGITVAIHRGGGDGTFAPYEGFAARGYEISPQFGQVIAVGDFDRNGSPDLVTVGELDKFATVLLNGADEPQTTITTLQSVFKTTGTSVKVHISFVSDAPGGATFACRLDQLAPVQNTGTWKPCTSPWSKTLTLGKYRLLVRATDTMNHTDPTPAKKKFTVKQK
jgi:hypothetical protein